MLISYHRTDYFSYALLRRVPCLARDVVRKVFPLSRKDARMSPVQREYLQARSKSSASFDATVFTTLLGRSRPAPSLTHLGIEGRLFVPDSRDTEIPHRCLARPMTYLHVRASSTCSSCAGPSKSWLARRRARPPARHPTLRKVRFTAG
ncbi:hypothetical protein PsYK624_133770 [Phanerochaete sordida]|uniref:Uncharacterized protein n=1 Tax=Phanerochaete sordida TaxID=48140 RepID=A0A9P3LJY7_9APHY|nr:hypothetical protein PsYK624_133770 [Phanerochaete sordida]